MATVSESPLSLVPAFDAMALGPSTSQRYRPAHSSFADTDVSGPYTADRPSMFATDATPTHFTFRKTHSPAPLARRDQETLTPLKVEASRQAEAVKLAANYASKITQPNSYYDARSPTSSSPCCSPRSPSAICGPDSIYEYQDSPSPSPSRPTTAITDEASLIKEYIDSTKKLRSSQRPSPTVQISHAQRSQYRKAFNIAAALAEELDLRLVELYSRARPTLLIILQLIDVICKVQEQADYFTAGLTKHVFTLAGLDAVISLLFNTLYQLTRDDTAVPIVNKLDHNRYPSRRR